MDKTKGHYTRRNEVRNSICRTKYVELAFYSNSVYISGKPLDAERGIVQLNASSECPPGFNCWFSFAPVFQWCWSKPQGSPGVGRNTLFLSSPHLCFIIVFICDLFASRDDALMS